MSFATPKNHAEFDKLFDRIPNEIVDQCMKELDTMDGDEILSYVGDRYPHILAGLENPIN